jgi:hypothetical protein
MNRVTTTVEIDFDDDEMAKIMYLLNHHGGGAVALIRRLVMDEYTRLAGQSNITYVNINSPGTLHTQKRDPQHKRLSQ